MPAGRMFVEHSAHLNLRFPHRERRRLEGRGISPACHPSGRLDDRRGNGAAVDLRAGVPEWPLAIARREESGGRGG